MMNCFLGYYIYVNLWNIVSFSFRRYYLWCIKMWRTVRFKCFESGVEITENFVEDPLSKHMRAHWKAVDPTKTLIEPQFFEIMQQRKKAVEHRRKKNLSVIKEESAEHSVEQPTPKAEATAGEQTMAFVHSSGSSSCSCSSCSSSEEE